MCFFGSNFLRGGGEEDSKTGRTRFSTKRQKGKKESGRKEDEEDE